MEQFDQIMAQLLRPNGASPIYNCMLSVHDGTQNRKYAGALGVLDEHGGPIDAHCSFRIGSITKPFTATVIFQLIEAGLCNPDDCFWNLIPENQQRYLLDLHCFETINYTRSITIRQLLQHRSGLRDYFGDDPRFLENILQNPHKQWTWEQVMEKYFEYGLHEKALGAPGQCFYYSDTNYLLLAVVIEALTGRTLSEEFETRILAPLNLRDTYLEFFQSPKTEKPTVYPYYGAQSLALVNTSFDWGGGGLVSTMEDLDVFIRALAQGRFFQKEDSLKAMMQFMPSETDNQASKRATLYGAGLQRKDVSGHSFVGHSSAYGSLMFYDMERDISVILSVNQMAAVHKAEWLFKSIIKSE